VWSRFLGERSPDLTSGYFPQSEMQRRLDDLRSICEALCLLLHGAEIIERDSGNASSSDNRSRQIGEFAPEVFSLHIALQCHRHVSYRITKQWTPTWMQRHSFEEFIALCRGLRQSQDAVSAFRQLL